VPDLIVVGDVMLDVSVASEALARGGDVHGEVRIRPGGTATNAAVWAAATGATVRVHGRVGADPAGRMVTDALHRRGVEVAMAVDPDARTGSMLVVHEAGERSMVADRGANARLSPDDLPARLEAGAVLVSGYLLFHPGSEPAARAALARARADHVAVDAASWPLIRDYGPDVFRTATAPATLLLANAAEAEALTGERAADAVTSLARTDALAGMKDGPRGAVIGSPDGSRLIPAPAAREVNPTGAGDAFDGVLLAHLARGDPVEDAVRAACRAGADAAGTAENWPEE
jgi:sugar/nucleoside kinase (ribokinase family)